VHSTVCLISVNTSNCIVCFICVTMSNAHCCGLHAASLYITLYRLLVLLHCVHCCLLRSLHSQSVPQNLPSVGSLTLYPFLSSTLPPLSVSTTHCNAGWFCVTVPTAVLKVSPLSLSTSHCTVRCFCVIVSIAVFYSISTVCQNLTL